MYALAATSWYIVPGKGEVALLKASSLPDDVWEPGEFVGTDVMIDGKVYYVSGCEKFMINIPAKPKPGSSRSMLGDRKHGYNLDFGLLVTPVKEK